MSIEGGRRRRARGRKKTYTDGRIRSIKEKGGRHVVPELGLTGVRGVCMEGAPERKGKERKGVRHLSSKSGFRGKVLAVLSNLSRGFWHGLTHHQSKLANGL